MVKLIVKLQNICKILDFFLDLAEQNVSMALRAHPRFEVTKNLPEIGWRALKQYYLVSC